MSRESRINRTLEYYPSDVCHDMNTCKVQRVIKYTKMKYCFACP